MNNVSDEIKAEMRNKIQAPVLVLDNLHKGREVPRNLIKTAAGDIEELKRLIENL